MVTARTHPERARKKYVASVMPVVMPVATGKHPHDTLRQPSEKKKPLGKSVIYRGRACARTALSTPPPAKRGGRDAATGLRLRFHLKESDVCYNPRRRVPGSDFSYLDQRPCRGSRGKLPCGSGLISGMAATKRSRIPR